jgi:hypothetical protein
MSIQNPDRKWPFYSHRDPSFDSLIIQFPVFKILVFQMVSCFLSGVHCIDTCLCYFSYMSTAACIGLRLQTGRDQRQTQDQVITRRREGETRLIKTSFKDCAERLDFIQKF